MNKITMQLAPLNGAVAESGKPLQTITLTLMGYVVQGQKGDPGDPGPAGDPGAKGDPGVGVPAGGLTGQVLAKTSDTDYATQWVDQTGGGGGGGGGTWGTITGTLGDQTDLAQALADKSDISHDHDGVYVKPGSLAAVATSGDYDDLLNKPRRAWRELIVADGVTPPTFLLNEAGTDYLYSEFIYE